MADGKKSEKTGRRTRHPLAWFVLSLFVVLVAATLVLAPCAIERIVYNRLNNPEIGLSCSHVDVDFDYLALIRRKPFELFRAYGVRFDAAPHLKGVATNLFANKTVSADVVVRSVPPCRGFTYEAEVRGNVLDWPLRATASAEIALTNKFIVVGRAEAGLTSSAGEPTHWCATADFACTTNGWNAAAKLPTFAFDESDPVLGRIVSRSPMPPNSKLSISGKVDVIATASQTKAKPVPAWSVGATIDGCSAEYECDGRKFSVEGLRIRPGISGVADHYDIRPIFARANSLKALDFELSSPFATIRATEAALLVTEAGAGFCGGEVRVYSVFLNPQKLNAGFALHFDGIDSGELLSHVAGFKGTASGSLHGKVPLRISQGREVHMGNAYLYSVPGEIGFIHMTDASALTEGLASSGVPEDECANIAKALENLDYDVLRFEFIKGDGDESTLFAKVEGTATSGETTVPVSFSVAFHGALEKLFNTGLNLAGKGKDEQ